MDIVQKKKNKSERGRIEKIRAGNKEVFEDLFFEYFYDLSSFALQITKSRDRAKDIVQEVFYRLWKRRKDWTIHSSLKAYLFQSVRNEALNQIDRQQNRKNINEQFTLYSTKGSAGQTSGNEQVDQQLLDRIWNVVSKLPDRRRSVFVLHRKHGLSYKEIAQVLDISRKTVENHMGLALEDIRKELEAEDF